MNDLLKCEITELRDALKLACQEILISGKEPKGPWAVVDRIRHVLLNTGDGTL